MPVNLVNTDYQCDFDAIVNANCGFWVEIGQNVNNTHFFGCTGSAREIGIYTKINGSNGQNTVSSNYVFANPSTPHFEYTCINNVHTLKCNGTTVSMTNSQITAKNYLRILARNTCNCKIKNIQIKPL